MPHMHQTMQGETHRIASLEALRGIAALIVVVWHTMLAFAPQTTGIFSQFPPFEAYTGSPFFFLMNGNGAVNVFFVLSGFVLSRKFFLDQDNAFIVKNAVRRYPRLALPVLISVIVSYLLFHFGLYHFTEAANVSGSPWLAKFGYAYDKPFTPSLLEAIKQGAFFTFFKGDASYNSSLWTMRYEFFGSFMVFGACLLLGATRDFKRLTNFYFIAIIALMSWYASPWYLAFVSGLFIALIMPRDGWTMMKRLPRIYKIACAFLAFFLLGYSQSKGVYTLFGKSNPILVNIAGSTILLILLTHTALQGSMLWIARFLGALSFPLYLIHLPVLFSLGCWLYLKINTSGLLYPVAWMIPLVLIISTAAAWPLMAINQNWLRFLNSRI